MYIGTSGWNYKHWKDRFYPDDVAKKRWLEYYAEHFNTVELNASFYRIPKPETCEGWYTRTPETFRFAVKASRLLTHSKKLKDCDDIVAWFFDAIAPLEEKAPVVLFQFPRNFVPSADRLERFFALLPENYRYVFEFRNSECYEGEIPEALQEHNIGFCIHDFPEAETPHLVTSDTVYLRFHGYESKYAGSYPDEVLREWAQTLQQWEGEGKTSFVFFNNDAEANAVKNATSLSEMVAAG